MRPVPERLRDAFALVAIVLAGYLYLAPASGALLRGEHGVMIGNGTDSITNPWQYALVLETLRKEPSLLLYGGIWSDQVTAPDGVPAFIPNVERVLVLLFAPLLSPDRMPTAMGWALMVLAGAAMYALGRALGFARSVALTLGLAWAYNPFTRARATVHIALAGLYWAPAALLALLLLARPPKWLEERRILRVALPAALLALAASTAHYFVIMGAALAPFFVGFYLLLLPKTGPRLRVLGRGLLRLALAALPAILLTGFAVLVPVPPSRRAPLPPSPPETTALFLRVFGAQSIDYVAGDVAFGTKDLIPPRSAITAEVRASVAGNWHERANGIRWSILALGALGLVVLVVPRLRRSLTPVERRVLAFALVLAGSSYLLAFSPEGIHAFGKDLGPVQLVNRVLPQYRVPNRIATMVHLALLLASGVVLTLLSRLRPQIGLRLSAAMPAVALLDYAPLEPVPLDHVEPVHSILARYDAEGDCGGILPVPYVTWVTPNADYFRLTSQIRGMSCKVVHARYLAPADDALRIAFGGPSLDDAALARAKKIALCAHARFLAFRLDLPEAARASLCSSLGWERVAPDLCRAPADTGPLVSVDVCANGL